MNEANPIAHLLLEQGVIDPEQLRYALRIREKLGQSHSLVRVLKELGYLSEEKLRMALRQQPNARLCNLFSVNLRTGGHDVWVTG